MQYAILADVHSNLEALEAVLADIGDPQVSVMCVGDVVGYGANPVECYRRLQALSATIIAGNHDWACVGKVDASHFNRYARIAIEWTRDQLGFHELNALRKLRASHTESLFTLVHGTLCAPQRFEYLIDAAQAVETAMLAQTPICFVGHTHRPLLIEIDPRGPTVVRVVQDADDLRHMPLTMDYSKYVINPGSVGQPRDGDPRASYALLNPDESWIEIHRVTYDIPAAQRKIHAAGLPTILAERLAGGQ
jgi:diadenosine tetraphosphatase ApaH/serine/threonine PP2A family protein phosphatase